VAGDLRFLQVTAGDDHTCGVSTENKVYCWGRNLEGQLGDGTVESRGGPVQVTSTRQFREVRVGVQHTCALTLSDLAFCWGRNVEGELGDGSSSDFLSHPVAVAGGLRWRQLTTNWAHSCGVTRVNRAYCWGDDNWHGALGDGSTRIRRTPTPVATGIQFLQIETGRAHTCAVNIGFRAYCWGDNVNRQLGDGTRTNRLTPTPVADTRRFDLISAGYDHSCAIARTTGKGVCWGAGYVGQLGNGTTFPRRLPTPVAGDLVFRQIDAGYYFSCGVTVDSRAYCWGNNNAGALGDGTTTSRLVPTPVAEPT
jgi:alpha-tubulin suppressor-like RCC1 family protein